MPRKKKSDTPFDGGIKVKEAVSALSAIEDEYNISPDDTLAILKSSFEKAYKVLVNDNAKNVEDMRVEATIDIDKGYLTMCEIKDVVDEVEDDFIQIELSEALEIEPEIKSGEEIRLPIDLTKLDSQFTHKVINVFLQRMREESKLAIKNSYSSMVGTLIVGEVENVDQNTVSINCGKASGTLFRRDMLKDERLKIGQKAKVYLRMVDEKKKNGILIISRSDDNFLRCLFKEYVQEIADGIVKIMGIAREAGVRSKVSVDTTNPDIDAAGSCIGPDGSRINSIRDEINKERVDIVRYSTNLPIYISEALRPATVIGVKIDEEEHRVVAVVKNDESKVAIGKGGINVRLASRLVGYSIDIQELDEAMAGKLTYQSLDDIRREMALSKLSAVETSGETEEEQTAAEAEYSDSSPSLDEADENGEAVETAPIKKPVVEEHIEILAKPKVSLADLEAQIENEKKNKPTGAPVKPYRRFKSTEISHPEPVEEKPASTPVGPAVPVMPIYTEDELAEIEAEENESAAGSFEDYDYDDYDEKY